MQRTTATYIYYPHQHEYDVVMREIEKRKSRGGRRTNELIDMEKITSSEGPVELNMPQLRLLRRFRKRMKLDPLTGLPASPDPSPKTATTEGSLAQSGPDDDSGADAAPLSPAESSRPVIDGALMGQQSAAPVPDGPLADQPGPAPASERSRDDHAYLTYSMQHSRCFSFFEKGTCMAMPTKVRVLYFIVHCGFTVNFRLVLLSTLLVFALTAPAPRLFRSARAILLSQRYLLPARQIV
jgi:hypothetical protein